MSTFRTRLKKFRHLSRIVAVPIGVNVLGLLGLFAFIGMLMLMNYLAPVAAVVAMCLAIFGIVGLDLWWRIGQPERSAWVRLFSLFTGGCFAFLPIWFVLSAGVVALSVIIIVKEITTH